MSIIFVYSGGVNNVDTFKSIGGIASAYKIPNAAVNNLFPNVLGESFEMYDYRCIYAINNSQGIHYDCEAYLTNTSGGSNVYLGISKLNSVQRMTINGNVTGGNISLNYKDRLGEDNTIHVNHDSNLETWGNNLQTALNGLGTLSEVIVNTRSALSDNIFDITFADSGGEPSEQNGGFRDQNLITVSDNNLTGSNSIIISHTQVGHPINSHAAEPGISTNAPAGVDFKEVSSPDSTIYIGNLYQQDVFAIWFKRVTPIINNRYAEAVEDEAKVVIVASHSDLPG
jgi:hypothetical protein